ncbi:MAG TPA: hypothetical protein VMV92_34865 [Streptosporangiaceae bacterium]|nr:hypothetical protein [Streptosporangiaceae bacterium]
MKLATMYTEAGRKAVRIDGDHAIDLGTDDLGTALPGFQVSGL